QQGLLGVTQRGFQALPATVTERYLRGDSACDEASLLNWLRDAKRAAGPDWVCGERAHKPGPTRRGRGYAGSAMATAKTARRSKSAPKWIMCRKKAPRIAIANRCGMWRSGFARSRESCLPTAARRS